MSNSVNNSNIFSVLRKSSTIKGKWDRRQYKIQNRKLKKVDSNGKLINKYGIISGYSNIQNRTGKTQKRVNIFLNDGKKKSFSFKSNENKQKFLEKIQGLLGTGVLLYFIADTKVKERKLIPNINAFGKTNKPIFTNTWTKFDYRLRDDGKGLILEKKQYDMWTTTGGFDLSGGVYITNWVDKTKFAGRRGRINIIQDNKFVHKLSVTTEIKSKIIDILSKKVNDTPHGGSKKRTKSKKSKKTSKRMRKIYVGPRGGKYIKKNGRKIYLNNLK
jgi:hypothetical protein